MVHLKERLNNSSGVFSNPNTFKDCFGVQGTAPQLCPVLTCVTSRDLGYQGLSPEALVKTGNKVTADQFVNSRTQRPQELDRIRAVFSLKGGNDA